MKIIFLDIDGVLKSHNFFTSLNYGTLNCKPDDMLDPLAIERLNKITRATDANIVVTSTWRYSYEHNFSGLVDLFKEHNIEAPVIAMTTLDSMRRDKQIKLWLSEHNDVESFIIIDDDDDDYSEDHFIQTSWSYGLEDKHIDLAISKLNKRN